MESEVIKLAVSQGIWCALFVALFFYVLRKQEARDKRSDEREQNYQGIIKTLTDKFNVLDLVREDVKEIKDAIFKK